MITIAKEYARIYRRDKFSLHLIRQATAEMTPFVVCWNLQYSNTDIYKAHWDWGTYCKTLDEAWNVFAEKCILHNFNLYLTDFPLIREEEVT